MADIGDLIVRLRLESSAYEKTMAKAVHIMEKAGERMKSVGKKMTIGVTAPLMLFAHKAVNAMSEFDSAMTNSLSIMGKVSPGLRKEMEETARSISESGPTSAAELARSYYYLASAGLSAEQSMKAVAVVNKFAIAGGMNLESATSLLADAQSALGLKSADAAENMMNMARVGDVLAMAANASNASTEQFSKALTTKTAAALRLLNKDVEEGVAVLEAFADQGIKAENAGEALSIAMRDWQTAAKDNAEAWNTYNLRVYDAKGKMLPLVSIVEQLERTMGPMTDKQKKATFAMLGFNDRSVSATQSLLGMSGKIREYERQLRNAGGTMDDVAKKQMMSFSNQMKVLENQFTNMAEKIGNILLPYIKKLADYADQAINWFNGLDGATKEIIVQIGILAAALGPFLVILGNVGAAIATIAGSALMSWVIAIAAVAAGMYELTTMLVDNDSWLSKFIDKHWLLLLPLKAVKAGIQNIVTVLETAIGLYDRFIGGVKEDTGADVRAKALNRFAQDYASGAITKEEYEKRKGLLENPNNKTTDNSFVLAGYGEVKAKEKVKEVEKKAEEAVAPVANAAQSLTVSKGSFAAMNTGRMSLAGVAPHAGMRVQKTQDEGVIAAVNNLTDVTKQALPKGALVTA